MANRATPCDPKPKPLRQQHCPEYLLKPFFLEVVSLNAGSAMQSFHMEDS